MLPAKQNLLGILMDPIDRERAAERILEASRCPRPFAASAIAVHGIMTGVLDPAHRYRLNQFDLLVADGQPVRWALNHIHHIGLKERVYGPSLMYTIFCQAEKEGLPVFLYGSTPEVLKLMSEKIAQQLPQLRLAGAMPSTFGELTPQVADQIAAAIRSSGARIVFVGLGCPRQEVWAYEFRDRVRVPIVAVGAAFPFLAGTVRQAPQWMQDRGLEWLFRLCMEPRRLWRRYLVLSPIYLALVFCQLLGFRFRTQGVEPQKELLYG